MTAYCVGTMLETRYRTRSGFTRFRPLRLNGQEGKITGAQASASVLLPLVLSWTRENKLRLKP